jgi:DNA-binding LytR/AlgR family response regulator
MLRCIIVDDDLISRESLERLCSKHTELSVGGVFDNARSALAFLEQEQPAVELIFLDVEMPGMSGLEFLDQLPFLARVIFTTSHSSYAFDAFEYSAVDFLKKPISMPRFEQAVAKALELSDKADTEPPVHPLSANEIYVRDEGCYVRISCDEILYFENVGDYVKVKTGTKQYVIHGSLKSVDEKLNDPRFLKVHRSFIINLGKIKNFDDNSVVIESSVIPVSRAHKSELMRRIKVF